MSFVERFKHPVEKVKLCLVFFVCFQQLMRFIDTPLDQLNIRKDQFQIDGFYISFGIYAAFYMNDIVVIKAAYNVDDCVDFADIGQEFIAQPFSFGSAPDKPRDIDKFYRCRRVFFRLLHLGKDIQAFIRHGDNANVGFYCTKRIIGRLRPGVCNRVK